MMAIKKIPAYEVILCLLAWNREGLDLRTDEQQLGFSAALFGVLGRMIIPSDKKEYVINKLRSLGRDDATLTVVERTIEQINAGEVVLEERDPSDGGGLFSATRHEEGGGFFSRG